MPYYFDFDINILNSYFLESIYIVETGEYKKIDIIDNTKRMDDIKKYFISEIHGWKYEYSVSSIVPGYILSSNDVEIDYKCSFITAKYRDGDDIIIIGKKVSTPFPVLCNIDESTCPKK